MSFFAKNILGEWPVYPGHPVTTGYIIMRKYPCLSAATEKGTTYPKALEDCDIPGAGGNVYSALDFLSAIKNGMPVETAIERWSKQWVEGRAGGLVDKVEPGVKEAEAVGRWLRLEIEDWIAL